MVIQFELTVSHYQNVSSSWSCRNTAAADCKPHDLTEIADPLYCIATECLLATAVTADSHVPPHADNSINVEKAGESSLCTIFSPVTGEATAPCLNANACCKYLILPSQKPKCKLNNFVAQPEKASLPFKQSPLMLNYSSRQTRRILIAWFELIQWFGSPCLIIYSERSV